MIKLDGIQNIIFDLGGVLLNLAPQLTLDAFRQLGSTELVEDNPWGFKHEVFYKMESGLVSNDEFRAGVRTMLAEGASDEQIDAAWTAMLLDIPKERVEVLLGLKKQFGTYLFSNTNAIHVAKFQSDFRVQHGMELSSLFVRDYYSNEIQVRKPDVKAFEKVIELSGVVPAETLFIDDSEENAKSAQQAGLHSLWLQKGMYVEKIFADFR